MSQDTYIQDFKISCSYPVVFTSGIFEKGNKAFLDLFPADFTEIPKALFIIDAGVFNAHPSLPDKILAVSANQSRFILAAKPSIVPGGEEVKNSRIWVDRILQMINENDICRHSYLIVIGGGAVLDMAGFAGSMAHRGIRVIRIPTTVLSQNDSGIGVKNGINAFGKKNFLGCFSPPYAVINDFDFISSLDDRDIRSGIAEAVKVALIKDHSFFNWMEKNSSSLFSRDENALKELIKRCALLHLQHIANGGDPFESGSSRPLDFGHWAAHKLEELTEFSLKHGEAVAIGIALDSCYSFLKGICSQNDFIRILNMFRRLGFKLFVPELEDHTLFSGLESFRVHLGGKLTITLPEVIGNGIEVNEMDVDLLKEGIRILKEYHPVDQEYEY